MFCLCIVLFIIFILFYFSHFCVIFHLCIFLFSSARFRMVLQPLWKALRALESLFFLFTSVFIYINFNLCMFYLCRFFIYVGVYLYQFLFMYVLFISIFIYVCFIYINFNLHMFYLYRFFIYVCFLFISIF